MRKKCFRLVLGLFFAVLDKVGHSASSGYPWTLTGCKNKKAPFVCTVPIGLGGG